ncbi:hypothetical protein H2200_000203 [Cladophialophora chaetospira]|uniref:Uncharacterized protein n=1 Tax=Cladophialophora chaetospira TaxID=386627 RepID=A0AA38XP14_9EURO|nr:hypothetical protein H2200_000203 [Cladophialophora chaetospira]
MKTALAILPFLAAWSAATPVANPGPALNFLVARDDGITNHGTVLAGILGGLLGGGGTQIMTLNTTGAYIATTTLFVDVIYAMILDEGKD